MSQPTVITADYDAIPKRYWELPYQMVHDLGHTYRYEECARCGKKIADHIWFLIDLDTSKVSDCSETPL
jgi:hypothetical protein